MNEEKLEGQKKIDVLMSDFKKLWLAMLVKDTVDGLARKLISSSPGEISHIVKPIHNQFKNLWMLIMQDNIDVEEATEQYKSMVVESNQTLPNKYRIIDPEDLLKKIEEWLKLWMNIRLKELLPNLRSNLYKFSS